MLRAACLAVLVVAQPLMAQAEDSAKSSPNAALKYWQAFATMPKLSDAEQNHLADYAEYPVNPQDGPIRDFVNQAEYALNMLHRGAAVRPCDWGVTYEEDGVVVRLPQVSAARLLTSLARLRGRMRLEAGQTKDGINDFLAAMTLARHVSHNGGFIAILVGYHLEYRLSDSLAVYLPKLDVKTIKDLQTRLEALPPFGSHVTSLLTCERTTLDCFVR